MIDKGGNCYRNSELHSYYFITLSGIAHEDRISIATIIGDVTRGHSRDSSIHYWARRESFDE